MPKITYLKEEKEPRYIGDLKGKGGKFVVLFLILAFIMGLIGGTGALLVLTNSKYLKDKLGINLQNLNISRVTTEKIILEESSAVIDATKKVSPAVVSISTTKNVQDFFGQVYAQEGAGTGFIITNDGLILTNKHVAQSGDTLQVYLTDGRSFTAEKMAVDPTNDLAILKIDATGLPVVELGDSNNLQVGQWVIAVGNALGQLQNTVTVGVISARERQLSATDGNKSEQLNNLLQTDTAINPGNSGGPLVNLAGQVIGINTAVAGNAQGIGFAIPINQAKAAIDSYKKTGKIIRPQLGVRYTTVNREVANQLKLSIDYGALILSSQNQPAVLPGSPAEKAGLKANDIITHFNGDRVDENRTLGGLILQYAPGDEVELKYLRDKKEFTTKVKLGFVE